MLGSHSRPPRPRLALSLRPALARAAAALAVVVPLAAAGCAATDDVLPDGDEDLASAAAALGGGSCPADAVFQPGAVSTAEDEGRLVFTPDGKTAYFHRFLTAENRLVILQSHRVGSGWSAPVIAPFSNTPYHDVDPFVTPDGQRFYFTSDRPTDGGDVARPDWELWTMPRVAGGWGAPVHLGPEVNTDANELFPTTTLDGTLYFNSDREGGFGAWDIYKARRRPGGFQPAENLGPGVNTEGWEFNPAVSPGGHLIFFGTLFRPDSLGGTDIYASVKLGGDWLPSWNLGSCVNTVADEYHPSIALRRGSLFFIRFSPETLGDVHEVGLGLP